jgi:hypothetical protein
MITGNGIFATIMTASNFRCERCFIEGLLAGGTSSLNLIDSELVGSFQVNTKSHLTLNNTDQTLNPDVNTLHTDSQLHMFRGSTILGETQVDAFSTGVFRFGTTHTGDLMCSTGGDVVCPRAMITGTSNCSQCLPPISLMLSTPQPGPQCGDILINGVVLVDNAIIVKLVWNWGDGHATERFFPASHSYSQNGPYTVQVTAHSNNGGTETQTTVHTISCFP